MDRGFPDSDVSDGGSDDTGSSETTGSATAAAMARRPAPTRFAASCGITNAVFVDLLRDPGLPCELRPPGWPGDELRVLVGRMATLDGPAAAAHIADRCGGAV